MIDCLFYIGAVFLIVAGLLFVAFGFVCLVIDLGEPDMTPDQRLVGFIGFCAFGGWFILTAMDVAGWSI